MRIAPTAVKTKIIFLKNASLMNLINRTLTKKPINMPGRSIRFKVKEDNEMVSQTKKWNGSLMTFTIRKSQAAVPIK